MLRHQPVPAVMLALAILPPDPVDHAGPAVSRVAPCGLADVLCDAVDLPGLAVPGVLDGA
eukprot:4687219-Pyramimonas_sp.AAC.1